MSRNVITLAVLVSGSGTTLQNLIDEIAAERLHAKIGIVIGSRTGLLGVQRAIDANIPTRVIERKSFADSHSFSRQVFASLDAVRPQLVCLAGWLSLLEIPDGYRGRIMNIHPALLPSFGGHGMYGARVHRAVIEHGCKVSGCTVHFVEGRYDEGPIILQRSCDVIDDDTPESLAHRVFQEEKIAYPEAIRRFADGRLRVEGRRVFSS